LLASAAHGQNVVPRLEAMRAYVGTEELVPPLPPLQPSLIGATNLPPGGSIFPSDHYPVFCDLQVTG
jgi:hypothetical protein